MWGGLVAAALSFSLGGCDKDGNGACVVNCDPNAFAQRPGDKLGVYSCKTALACIEINLTPGQAASIEPSCSTQKGTEGTGCSFTGVVGGCQLGSTTIWYFATDLGASQLEAACEADKKSKWIQPPPKEDE